MSFHRRNARRRCCGDLWRPGTTRPSRGVTQTTKQRLVLDGLHREPDLLRQLYEIVCLHERRKLALCPQAFTRFVIKSRSKRTFAVILDGEGVEHQERLMK